MSKFFQKLLPAIGLFLLAESCQKEVALPEKNTDNVTALASAKPRVSRPYKDDFTTWFQFIPGEGWSASYPTFQAYYPGGGKGNATYLGSCKTFFNQFVPLAPPPIASVAAPVTMFYAGELAAAGLTTIPGHVSTINYDGRGNSIWFTQTSSVTTPASPSRLDFVATANIVGGTGRFAGATGSITIRGYLNPTDTSDAAFTSEGTIVY